MSKKRKNNQNAFKYTSTLTLPKLQSIKTEWDLEKLYYESESDPQIEKDLLKTERAYERFAKKYENKAFVKSAAVLKTALTDMEKLSAMPEASKAQRYYSFRSVLDAKDEVAQKQLALLAERFRKLSDKILFFSLTLGKVPKAKQREYLQNPTLKKFHYYLERVWVSSQYDLSESEEKIINLKERQSHGMWIDMVDKIISNRTIQFKGETIAVNTAIEMIDLQSPKDKVILWERIMQEMEQIAEVAEHEFNAIITDVRNEEELRGYKKPYSSTAIAYEDSEKSIENLVQVVSDTGFTLSKKFYKLKAKYHKEKQLHYTRKYESIGAELSVPFPEAVEICRDVFYGVKNEYGKVFDTMLKNGQIDVYPKAGKRGGAFMSEQINHPTHVFLNHVDSFKSLETLAHEMGHAIHAERGKKQPPIYQGHSITTAETASTLFENLLFDAVYEQASDKQKPILLHDRIARDIATIQRQIAFFNCELEIHNTIKQQGAMTKAELRDCMYLHLKSYLGPAISLTPQDGYSFVYVSHFRYGFYVYTYTFGILMSTIMANNYKKDKSYIKEIDTFLCAGESDTVANIFKLIGIDTSKENTFLNALKNHENDICAFEDLVKSKK